MSEWTPVERLSPPNNPERDYGVWCESLEVLVWANGNIYIARKQTPREEYAPDGWILQGRDGYALFGVTYWRFLPDGP